LDRRRDLQRRPPYVHLVGSQTRVSGWRHPLNLPPHPNGFYDPREAIPFWQRMSQQEGKSSPPEFLSTHPATETRIANIKKYIPEALPYFEKSTK